MDSKIEPVAWVVTAPDRVDYIFGDFDKAAAHGTPRPLFPDAALLAAEQL